MKFLLPAVGCMLLLAGCSSHYQRIHGDTLTLYLDKPAAIRCSWPPATITSCPTKPAMRTRGGWYRFPPVPRFATSILLMAKYIFLPVG